jgi:hypothetical protein
MIISTYRKEERMPQQKDPGVDLAPALGVWAKRNNVRVIDFARSMGFSYNYSWGMFHGKNKFGPRTWGTFASVYGLDALKEIFKIGKYDPKGEIKT